MYDDFTDSLKNMKLLYMELHLHQMDNMPSLDVSMVT